MIIKQDKELDSFIASINEIFINNHEIWVIDSSVIKCWRCRIYLSVDSSTDMIEMAYSYEDHILDHIKTTSDVPYVCYKKTKKDYKVLNTNIKNDEQTKIIVEDITNKYSTIFKKIKDDLSLLKIKGISLDVRVNNSYDFHDFDVTYTDIKRVINYYLK